MITIREFVKNNIGGRYDADGMYGYQCVDLIYLYLKEVFGKPRNSKKLLGDAKYNYQNIVNYGFTSIKYDGNNRPKRGDVISFIPEKANGNAGHVGVCLAYNEKDKKVYILEQNGGRNSTTGTGNDSIRVAEIHFSKMLGWGRAKNISSIVEKDYFDKIVFNKGLYIGENDLKRDLVVKSVFYFLAGYKDNFNGKTYKDLGITKNLDYNTTRQELAYIILAFLNKILGKNLTLQDLQNKGIWNGQRPNDKVSGYEFTLMVNKTKEVFGL